MAKIAWLEVGESLLIRAEDWKPKTPFSSYFRQYARKANVYRERKFRIQSLKGDQRGWLITRTRD